MTQLAAQVYTRVGSRVDGQVVPSMQEFAELGRTRRIVPVIRRVLVDFDTPVCLYRKLAANRPGTYLLESAENNRQWSRYSFVGVRCAAMLTTVAGKAVWAGEVPADLQSAVDVDGEDPLAGLRESLRALHSERIPGLPPLTSGLVGMIGYDAVRRWERIPDLNPDVLQLPEVALLLATDLAVFDHFDGSVMLIANAVLPNGELTDAQLDAAYQDAISRLDDMMRNLAQPTTEPPVTLDQSAAPHFESDTTAAEFADRVEAVREHVYAGDAFQVVISQRFHTKTTASALDIYRVLRVSNPSPYMYVFRFPQVVSNPDGTYTLGEQSFDVVGSSPEALVKLESGNALMHPIAGTKPRGKTAEHDQQLADELLADEKERAEHLMLVDLGRNDLSRVCAAGSVEVVEFMQVERYSHVMHIVSTVVGKLADDKSAYDLLAATFPAGTLSGAPKPKAMEIIEKLETSRRGLYGGCVGYLDFAGDLDTAIAIRTAVLRDGVAYVQAGAGLVADSDPATEQQECLNKAAAVLRAIAIAESMRAVSA